MGTIPNDPDDPVPGYILTCDTPDCDNRIHVNTSIPMQDHWVTGGPWAVCNDCCGDWCPACLVAFEERMGDDADFLCPNGCELDM
jgi:hypothetical protein